MKKKIQRTVFGQDPCQAYLRHAHIVLFGKCFDTSEFQRTGEGGVMVVTFRGARQGGGGRYSPPDNFLVAGMLQVIVVPPSMWR
jgi:hypothetical protein